MVTTIKLYFAAFVASALGCLLAYWMSYLFGWIVFGEYNWHLLTTLNWVGGISCLGSTLMVPVMIGICAWEGFKAYRKK